jgi:hypothetical protein
VLAGVVRFTTLRGVDGERAAVLRGVAGQSSCPPCKTSSVHGRWKLSAFIGSPYSERCQYSCLLLRHLHRDNRTGTVEQLLVPGHERDVKPVGDGDVGGVGAAKPEV